jgi:superfamily II DNA or RNA helicase
MPARARLAACLESCWPTSHTIRGMSRHERGLYEVLITEALNAQLHDLGDRLEARRSDLRAAEAADRIALHLARVVQRAVASVGDDERVAMSIALARRLIEQVDATIAGAGMLPERPLESGSVLRSLASRRPDGTAEIIREPLIPLLDTTLLTNAPGEPRAYTGSTEPRALEALRDLGAEVRVSYDTSTTRLHAKAWLFHRRSGFSTAYIGSSNLTHAAQVSGLEWNVRVSGARNPDVIEKVAAVFESYWNSGDFVAYDQQEFLARTEDSTRTGTSVVLFPTELRPEPFQERLLEQIALSRQGGHHRNLLASATGTGKTVMAALDYARLREELPRDRLLFVAHREEILEQSLMTFRHALRDHAFGELWVGGRRPRSFEHVFASIQSLHVAGLENLDRDHFDVVVIDEFHHSAAPTYRALLDHTQPAELLGLTATPERSDGLPVLDWFDHRIAAELRLWDAIDQHRLSPFVYYGVHDGLDLREVPWRRGRGYDVDGLTNLLAANDAWARLVLKQVVERVDGVARIRALGFSAAVAIWADTPEDERRSALSDLAARRVNVVFSVDLFNEGIDVPRVDTLLLLRPTDSPTLFLQQLGRGLRRSPGKTV